MARITRDTTLAEVLKQPRADRILEKYKIPCLHCPMAVYEMGRLRIGEIAETYGIDLNALLKELNKKPVQKGGNK